MKQGVVDNSMKTLCPGVSIIGFAQGNKETNDFINDNKEVFSKRLSWVNDPRIIAQNDTMISINSCMAVDLRGQVCSESIGTSIFGGSGGQLDFVRGARMSENGQSFIALRSVIEKPNGELLSKITLTLPEGSIVTTPRNDVQYIVTEYGIAQMDRSNLSSRTRALIAISHPAFREKLEHDAKRVGLI
jgi:4-hydroxybutyrate CoA-transferase